MPNLKTDSISRRRFLQCVNVSIATSASLAMSQSTNATSVPVKIGLITDIHYADKPVAGTRHYRESKGKLTEAVELFRNQEVDFIVNLGDLIDAANTVEEELKYLKVAENILESSKIPRHYVLGNHCVATLTKDEFRANTNGHGHHNHYSFDQAGFHFVILDACFNKKFESYGRNNFDWKDTNLPADQIQWLREDLNKSKNSTIVFIHHRLDLNADSSPYAVKQSEEVRKILEKSNKVTAVFQGHSHKNELHRINGIPYCTVAAVIEGAGKQNNAYGVLELDASKGLRLTGYRKQRSFVG